MAVSGSLQLSHDLGLCKNQGYKKRFQLWPWDYWSSRLSANLCRPMFPVSQRRNVFRCHSFLIPGQTSIPGVKAASTALKRSYNALQGSPVILKLAPPIGVIVFAVWGLGPVMRQSRNILLKRNDNNWKKSHTYYVMTSHIQPLLLGTAAIFICSVIQQAQKFFMESNETCDTRNMGFQFAGKAVYSAVWIAAVSLFMELLGFSTQKWLTADGLGTVLLTLAGREIFTNFLSSAMIHATRPFVVNEWIQTRIEGYEEHVGWWSPTIIRGEDREAVHIPNHKFTVNVVRNLSQKNSLVYQKPPSH